MVAEEAVELSAVAEAEVAEAEVAEAEVAAANALAVALVAAVALAPGWACACASCIQASKNDRNTGCAKRNADSSNA